MPCTSDQSKYSGLARFAAAQQPGGLTRGYRVKQDAKRLTCSDGQARVLAFVGIRAEHDPVPLVPDDRAPTHLGATGFNQLLRRL